MPHIERLSNEIIQHIADMCTWDLAPTVDGFPSPEDSERYRRGDVWHPATYARYHAALARTSWHFHSILNKGLYRRNLTRDPAQHSCVRWAVQNHRLDTIRRAYQYGADLSSYGTDPDADLSPTARGTFCRYYRVNGVRILRDNDDRLGTPLYDAVCSGFSDIVAFLLDAGVDVNVTGRGKTDCEWEHCYWATDATCPLHIALKHGRSEYTDALVRHGAYLATKGVSALEDAHSAGLPNLVEALLQRNDATSMISKFFFAASTHNLELMTRALEQPGVNINRPNWNGSTALSIAITSDKKGSDIIKFLLRQPGIEFRMRDLIQAIARGRPDIVELLIDMLRIDLTQIDSVQLLYMTAKSGSKELLDFFLGRPEISIPDQYDTKTILSHGCAGKDDGRAMSFIQHMIDIGFPITVDCSVLNCAIESKNFQTALLLLPLVSDEMLCPRRDVNRGIYQASPLHCALMQPHDDQTKLVEAIVARGIGIDFDLGGVDTFDPQARSPRLDGTPLFFATAFARNKDCMKLLIQAGANPNAFVSIIEASATGNIKQRTMSMISALLRYVWRERGSVMDFPAAHADGWKETTLRDDSFELEERILILLEHGATIGSLGDWSSALRLVCLEAELSSSTTLLTWLAQNANLRNVCIEDVDSLVDEFSGRKEKPMYGEISHILVEFREKLHRETEKDM